MVDWHIESFRDCETQAPKSRNFKRFPNTTSPHKHPNPLIVARMSRLREDLRMLGQTEIRQRCLISLVRRDAGATMENEPPAANAGGTPLGGAGKAIISVAGNLSLLKDEN
jgi:hypothetical protein